MKTLSIAATALAFAGTAQAADLYVKAPAPAAAPVYYDWSGIYIGANGGYGWGDAGWRSLTDSDITTAGEAFSTQPKGALAGGQIGINRQTGSWVWGFELTGDWSDLKESKTGAFPDVSLTDTWTTKLRDLETLTARVGYAYNNWLFYGKAGGATGDVSVKAVAGVGPPGFNIAGATFEPQSQRLWGTTVGGGIEYGLTPNIILGVEYNFTRLFASQYSANLVLGGASQGPVSLSPKSPFDVQTVTGRLSYKF